MTLSIRELAPGEYILNPGLPGPLEGETTLLEFESSRLQTIIKGFSEHYSTNLSQVRRTQHHTNFLLTGLLCKINYLDGEIFNYLPQKKTDWLNHGFGVSYMPPLLRSPAHRGKKINPQDQDGLLRVRQPSIMYAYLGHNSIVSRITLADELIYAGLIDPKELFGE